MANVYAKNIQQQQVSAKGQKRKKTIVVLSSILAVFLIAIVILSVVPVRTYNKLSDNGFVTPLFINVVRPGDSTPTVLDASTSEATTKDFNGLQKSLKSTRFSVMRGWLEGKFNFGMTIDLEVDEDDENDDGENELLNVVSKDTLRGLAGNFGDAAFLVVMGYDTMQTVTIKDTEIKYDRIAFYVKDEGNVLTRTQIYFYDQSAIDPVISDSEYFAYEVHMLGNMQKLYLYLTDMFDETT